MTKQQIGVKLMPVVYVLTGVILVFGLVSIALRTLFDAAIDSMIERDFE